LIHKGDVVIGGTMPFPKILVVEDYSPLRQLICLTLQQREFQVIEASDGLEAVKKAEELQPDLVLMDIGLPKLNGIEAAKRIRRFAPGAKLLFVSQESDSDLVQETYRLGGRAFVHKSLAMTDLLPAIQAVLSGTPFVSRGLQFNESADAHNRHEVQFYANDSVFLSSAARFIADSLKVANATIVLATKPHREGLVQRLNAEGIDTDGAIQQGTYISLDAADTLSTIMVEGVPDAARFSAALCGLIESAAKVAQTEHPRIAILGECVGLLYAEGSPDAAISLEKIGNDLIKTQEVDILCAYPLRSQNDDRALNRICAEHTAVYWQ
jgi:DNA-binding NarL/FixJ family response regulator